jgi:hypothetical protein
MPWCLHGLRGGGVGGRLGIRIRRRYVVLGFAERELACCCGGGAVAVGRLFASPDVGAVKTFMRDGFPLIKAAAETGTGVGSARIFTSSAVPASAAVFRFRHSLVAVEFCLARFACWVELARGRFSSLSSLSSFRGRLMLVLVGACATVPFTTPSSASLS